MPARNQEQIDAIAKNMADSLFNLTMNRLAAKLTAAGMDDDDDAMDVTFSAMRQLIERLQVEIP